MIQLKAKFTCDSCKGWKEFWVGRYGQIPAMASRTTNGEFSGVSPKNFEVAAKMCGERRMTLLLCRDCCEKFKGEFSYAPTAS